MAYLVVLTAKMCIQDVSSHIKMFNLINYRYLLRIKLKIALNIDIKRGKLKFFRTFIVE